MIDINKLNAIDDTNSILLNEIDACISVYHSDIYIYIYIYDIIPGVFEDKYDNIFSM